MIKNSLEIKSKDKSYQVTMLNTIDELIEEINSFSNVISSMFLPKLTKITVVNSDKSELMKILIKISRIQFYIASFIFCSFTERVYSP